MNGDGMSDIENLKLGMYISATMLIVSLIGLGFSLYNLGNTVGYYEGYLDGYDYGVYETLYSISGAIIEGVVNTDGAESGLIQCEIAE